MQLGRVVGTATSTIKHPALAGLRLLVVQLLAADGRSPDGEPQLVVDRLGAGRGQTVMVTSDSDAIVQMVGRTGAPLRWSVLGIRD